MRTRTAFISLLAVGVLAQAMISCASSRRGGREMVRIVHIVDPDTPADEVRVYFDGRYVSPSEAAALKSNNVQSTMILRGGRPYIDEQIRVMMETKTAPAVN